MRKEELTAAIAEAAKAHGYRRLAPFKFKANWPDTSIEHFLFFMKFDGMYVHADFGMRDEQAQNFATECIRPYMPPGFDRVVNGDNYFCYLRYPLGRIADWGPRHSLDWTELHKSEFVRILNGAIADRKSQEISEIRSRCSLLQFLRYRSDDVNGGFANKAAQIAYVCYLSHSLGASDAAVHAELCEQTQKQSVRLSGMRIDQAAFIEDVSRRLQNCGLRQQGCCPRR